jgi:hypothetical protein
MTIRELLDALDGAGIIVVGDDDELNAGIQEWLHASMTLDTEITFPTFTASELDQ